MTEKEIIEIQKYFVNYKDNKYYHNYMDDFHIAIYDDNEVYQLDTDHEIFGNELKTLEEFNVRFKSFTGEDLMKDKTYTISTVEDIVNTITPDNFGNFMIDFTDIMVKITHIKRNHKKVTGEYPKSIMKTFTWIDDSFRGVKELRFDNGEVLKFKDFQDTDEEQTESKSLISKVIDMLISELDWDEDRVKSVFARYDITI